MSSQVLTVGALHRVNSVVLRDAASAWHVEMAQLPKPLLVVSVGGPTGIPFFRFVLNFELLGKKYTYLQ